MTIDIEHFVKVDISVAPTAFRLGRFGHLMFVTQEVAGGSPWPVKQYASLGDVLVDWPATTEAGKAATAFYGQTPQPTDFSIAQMPDHANPRLAVVIGHNQLSTFLNLPGGDGDGGPVSMTVVVDGVPVTANITSTLGPLATVLGGITTALQDAGAQVALYEYHGIIYARATDGTVHSIQFPSEPVSDYLGLSEGDAWTGWPAGGEYVTGIVGESVERIDKVTAVLLDHRYIDNSTERNGESIQEIATFMEGLKTIYLNETRDGSVKSAGSTITRALAEANLRYTMTTFIDAGSQYPSASAFARLATVNYELPNQAITLNLKQLPGVPAVNVSEVEMRHMQAARVNANVRIRRTSVFASGVMADGGWIDNVHALMWLEDKVAVSLYNLLYRSTTRIPYTTTGINKALTVLRGVLQTAVNNGLAAPGYAPDGTYYPAGYEATAVPIAQVDPADKSNRIYKGLSFTIIGAGALHQLVVSGTFSE